LIFDWPLGVQIADITGIWGVTFWTVLVNATLATAVQGGTWRQVGIRCGVGVGIPLVVLSYGGFRLSAYDLRLPTLPSFQVGTVQQVAWMEKDLSWAYRSQRYQELTVMSEQAVAAGSQLVVWPEGALRSRVVGTFLESQVIRPILSKLPAGGGLITGASEPDPTTLNLPGNKVRFINSALLYGSEGNFQDSYGKQWLFPFFESSRFTPSPDGYRPLRGGSVLGALGAMVCLESVLPAPSRRLVQTGAESLVVISDDSWFGNSNWPLLHGHLSVFRAVENRRSVVFVNNTGGNLIVDPCGRIQESKPTFVRDTVVGKVYRNNEETLANQWGDWFAWVTLMGSGILAYVRFLPLLNKP
jgi:apolipoprotein N-acyltransferase